MTHTRRIPPIWLLGLANSTFGMFTGIVGISLPQLLAEQHVPEARVAAVNFSLTYMIAADGRAYDRQPQPAFSQPV
ncbi:MAG: hypothetical protein WBY53_02555 [Acidobacteriaceae bacterium]